ncbi:hypothetical protein M9Y10_041786 [Tritrichomonas musculus]|uniref:Uncharacterized protein n=1 Tax=Tritrichomonas musculus TaxID=1915356 RepID=A0ABR2K5H6_9EUKA
MTSVKTVLENPKSTTIDVLKCQDVLNSLKSNDQKLMEFLLQPQHIKDIFNILTKTFARSDHKRVLQLFSVTNNVSLHRVFAESIPLTEYALSVLEKFSDHDMYAAGTISRIFQRAIDIWPDEIYDVFHYSDTLYKTVIENINKDVVYMTISDSMTMEKEFFTELVWYLFISLVKTSNEKSDPSNQLIFEHPPRRCYLSKNLYNELPSFGNSDSKILNAILIIKQYFSLNFPCTDDFGEYVLKYIVLQAKSTNPNIKFYYQYYDIAKNIGYCDELQEIVIDIVKKASNVTENTPAVPSLRSPLLISALSYLEVCAKHFDEKTLLSLVATLLDDKNTQFGLLSMVQIVKEATSMNPEWIRDFKETMSQLIACAWNKYHLNNPLIVSILVDLSILLAVEEKSNPSYQTNIQEWKRPEFILSSVNQQANIFDPSITFPDSAYNIDELNKLRWGLPF